MPESEIFKVIIQLGSFGLLAIAVVWMLYYGAPMIRDTVTALGKSHEAAVAKIAEENKRAAEKHAEALESLGDRHEKAVASLVAEQSRLVQQLDANCREERLGLAKMLAQAPPIRPA